MIGSEGVGVTRQVTAALDALGVEYGIGGSLVRIVHSMVGQLHRRPRGRVLLCPPLRAHLKIRHEKVVST